MRRLATLVLLLSLVGCGSEVTPQATSTPSPSAAPTLTPTPDETPSSAPAPSASSAPVSGTTGAPTSTAPATVAPEPVVVIPSPGQRYAVTAEVVHLPGNPDQVCAPTAPPVAKGDPKACAYGLTVKGVDVGKLQDRREKDGAVQGRATLSVTRDSKGVLQVVSQSVPAPLVVDTGVRTPPCAPPKGGWPKGKDNEDLDLSTAYGYREKHPGNIVAIAQLRVSKNQVVAYVLTNGDPAPVDRDLRPTYGARFCAFRSSWTTDQLNKADLDPAFRYGRARGVYLRRSSDLSLSGQLELVVGVVTTTAPVVAAVRKAPRGLVRLEVLLTPVAA